jgi:hypothetical protein
MPYSAIGAKKIPRAGKVEWADRREVDVVRALLSLSIRNVSVARFTFPRKPILFVSMEDWKTFRSRISPNAVLSHSIAMGYLRAEIPGVIIQLENILRFAVSRSPLYRACGYNEKKALYCALLQINQTKMMTSQAN